MALTTFEMRSLKAEAYRLARESKKTRVMSAKKKKRAKATLTETVKFGVGFGFGQIDLPVVDLGWKEGAEGSVQPMEVAFDERAGDRLGALVDKVRSKFSSMNAPEPPPAPDNAPPLPADWERPGPLRLYDGLAGEADQAHTVKDRDERAELVKELAHQADQFARAASELDKDLEKMLPRAQIPLESFRDCEDMAECLRDLYYAVRKYNKMLYFCRQMESEYRAIKGALNEMDNYWRGHYGQFIQEIKNSPNVKATSATNERDGLPSIRGSNDPTRHLYDGNLDWQGNEK